MLFSNTKNRLSKEFRRVAAVALLATAPLALVGCNDHSKDARKQDTATAVATAQPAHTPLTVEDLCLYGCPTGAPADDTLIRRSIYTLDNNPHTKFADWVAYEVTSQTIGTTKQRVWHRDPDLPADETLSPKDYKGIRAAMRMDRGHQAPLASLTGTADWQMADDLSNITPQSIDLNEGPWERLENGERKIAQQDALTVYSVTGPLYERTMPTLPNAHLNETTPSGYWKIVAVVKGNEVDVAAFIMDQSSGREDDFCEKAVTVRMVESHAHLKFFPKMNEAEREQLETKPGKLLPMLNCGR